MISTNFRRPFYEDVSSMVQGQTTDVIYGEDS